MRILHLMKTSVGGAWALRQVSELIKNGIDIVVALPDGPLVDEYRRAGAKIVLEQFDFPTRNPILLLERCKRLRKTVDAIAPDIIHSHFVGTTLTMRVALRKHNKIPRIFMVPGPLHLEHALFRKIEISIAQDNDFWIGSCEWTRNCYIRHGVPANRVGLAYYGGYPEQFAVPAHGILRQELNLQQSDKLVGMVAFMYAPKRYLLQSRGIKGHEDMIESIAICRKQYKNIYGILVGGAWGDGQWYEDKIRKFAKKVCPDGIFLLGSRHDIPSLYPDFDIAVHPSLSENLGGTVESCLAKIPTIATNIGGFPDVIKNNITGMLIPPRSPQALSEAIMNMLQDHDKAQAMAESANRLVKGLCDVRNNANSIEAYYRTILNKRIIHV